MLYAAIVLILLFFLFLLSLRGRTGHQGLPAFRNYRYAHRGLYGGDIPENSLEAFRAARDAGYGVELDVHLLRDGTLAILHDSDLKRMTGLDGVIEDLTKEDLSRCRLNGTGHTVPTFASVLEVFDGKAPMIVELKTYRSNHAALCQAACQMLDGYKGPYCLESFDPRVVYWLKKNRPDLIRGQLTENFITRLKGSQPWILRFIATYQLQSFVTRPDFIACRYSDRKTLTNYLCRKLWHIQGVSWTIQTTQELQQAEQEGWIPIFENIRP